MQSSRCSLSDYGEYGTWPAKRSANAPSALATGIGESAADAPPVSRFSTPSSFVRGGVGDEPRPTNEVNDDLCFLRY